MKNSAIWCLNLFGCFNVTADDIKIFGQWRYNADGIDIVNCQDIFINNSFVHSFDDTITIKGIDRYYHIDNKNIHVNNCVLWCDWGKCCEVGVETTCREYENITFKNCDVLRGGYAALDISNGDCAEIHNIKFENINVEYNSFDTKELYQKSDDEVYNLQDTISVPYLIFIRNSPFRTPENLGVWGLPLMTDLIDLTGIKQRGIHDVLIKNINVYYDSGMPLVDGKPDIRYRIVSQADTEPFYNIEISDIFVNGEKLEKKFEF